MFNVGERVRIARIVDDFKCHHIGMEGIVDTILDPGFTQPDARYLIVLPDHTELHLFFEAELERVG